MLLKVQITWSFTIFASPKTFPVAGSFNSAEETIPISSGGRDMVIVSPFLIPIPSFSENVTEIPTLSPLYKSVLSIFTESIIAPPPNSAAKTWVPVEKSPPISVGNTIEKIRKNETILFVTLNTQTLPFPRLFFNLNLQTVHTQKKN